MDLTVVIVNYRVKYFLEQTLRSVFESTQGLATQVIVIDNASGDDSIAFARERFPQVTFIENVDNVGFARANNQGINLAQGRYTLILNPDTIVTPQCLAQCIEHMAAHDDCGAIGVRMIDGNGVFLPESKRSFPTPWVSFCKAFGLSRLFPCSPWFAKYHLRYLSDTQAHEVDILSGAYMLCRTSVLQRIGGLDEDFFMYGEDIDLSYRITRAGYRNWFLPVNMLHYKGESTKKDSMRYVKVFYEAMLIFYRKHFPHYSCVMHPLIRAGVMVRASMSAFKRLCVKVLPSRRTHSTCAPWVILSSDALGAAQAVGAKQFTTIVPATGKARVLIDDNDMTYGEIVEHIAEHSREGLDYHIFARRHGVVISPKM